MSIMEVWGDGHVPATWHQGLLGLMGSCNVHLISCWWLDCSVCNIFTARILSCTSLAKVGALFFQERFSIF